MQVHLFSLREAIICHLEMHWMHPVDAQSTTCICVCVCVNIYINIYIYINIWGEVPGVASGNQNCRQLPQFTGKNALLGANLLPVQDTICCPTSPLHTVHLLPSLSLDWLTGGCYSLTNHLTTPRSPLTWCRGPPFAIDCLACSTRSANWPMRASMPQNTCTVHRHTPDMGAAASVEKLAQLDSTGFNLLHTAEVLQSGL